MRALAGCSDVEYIAQFNEIGRNLGNGKHAK
jgi:hypothetical protein